MNVFSRHDEGKSDKEILDNLVKRTRYDKRLLPPVDGKNAFVFLLPHISEAKYYVQL